jgi:hypothetical protein
MFSIPITTLELQLEPPPKPAEVVDPPVEDERHDEENNVEAPGQPEEELLTEEHPQPVKAFSKKTPLDQATPMVPVRVDLLRDTAHLLLRVADSFATGDVAQGGGETDELHALLQQLQRPGKQKGAQGIRQTEPPRQRKKLLMKETDQRQKSRKVKASVKRSTTSLPPARMPKANPGTREPRTDLAPVLTPQQSAYTTPLVPLARVANESTLTIQRSSTDVPWGLRFTVRGEDIVLEDIAKTVFPINQTNSNWGLRFVGRPLLKVNRSPGKLNTEVLRRSLIGALKATLRFK